MNEEIIMVAVVHVASEGVLRSIRRNCTRGDDVLYQVLRISTICRSNVQPAIVLIRLMRTSISKYFNCKSGLTFSRRGG